MKSVKLEVQRLSEAIVRPMCGRTILLLEIHDEMGMVSIDRVSSRVYETVIGPAPTARAMHRRIIRE